MCAGAGPVGAAEHSGQFDFPIVPGDLSNIGGPHPTLERIYVRADKGVRYEAFMAVVNRLQASGYRQVGLVAEAL